jgi:hypothetical protein
MSGLPNHYRIRVKGRLDPSWSDHLAGMVIEHLEERGEPTSIVTGQLPDQSALAGVINALVDMQCEVLSVHSGESRPSETG